MIVFITEEAEADLEAIGDFIALDNPQRSISFVEELRRCCDDLAEVPHAFPLVPLFETSGIHRRVHGNYLIFYRIGEAAVEVLHVLHGARDYGAMLGRPE